MNKFRKLVQRFSAEESGATMVEYALLAGLIGVAAVTAITALRTRLNGTFTAVTNALPATP